MPTTHRHSFGTTSDNEKFRYDESKRFFLRRIDCPQKQPLWTFFRFPVQLISTTTYRPPVPVDRSIFLPVFPCFFWYDTTSDCCILNRHRHKPTPSLFFSILSIPQTTDPYRSRTRKTPTSHFLYNTMRDNTNNRSIFLSVIFPYQQEKAPRLHHDKRSINRRQALHRHEKTKGTNTEQKLNNVFSICEGC